AGVPGDQQELPLMRRYDVADRRRNVADLSAVFGFGDKFGFDYTAAYSYDDYTDSLYGLVNDQNRNHVFGVRFVPFSPCEVRLEKGNEFTTFRQNNRFRNLLFALPADSKKEDWSDETTIKTETWLIDFV